MGRGANCIVYGAVYNDSIGVKHNVRLKECYPAYLLLSRADDNSLSISVEKENEFEDIKEKIYTVIQEKCGDKTDLGTYKFNSKSGRDNKKKQYSLYSYDTG